MQRLSPDDLLTLEAYSAQRTELRKRALAHKRIRTLHLGEHVTLLFEDSITVQAQVQEMLRIERIFEVAGIQDELDAYNPLIPDGSNLKATLLIEFPDPVQRTAELARLRGIERAFYAEAVGQGRAVVHADEDLDRSDGDKTSAVHFLRFEFAPDTIVALRDGAALVFGIDDARLPQRIETSAELREVLLRDFDY
ncbi:MAG TPA: DUF3501 family protein [Xanthomonadaceae bacterium]|jgi:hypothetical protein|nr:DUF3501 family protein [Xanthomonadaceae bacterium]